MSTDDLDPNQQIVWELYRGLCVMCQQPASEVHEIRPKSQDPAHWMDVDNRVTLCREDHWKVHNQIGTRAAASMLKERAAFTLSLFA